MFFFEHGFMIKYIVDLERGFDVFLEHGFMIKYIVDLERGFDVFFGTRIYDKIYC